MQVDHLAQVAVLGTGSCLLGIVLTQNFAVPVIEYSETDGAASQLPSGCILRLWLYQ